MMSDEAGMWVLVAMGYASGFWHGWITGGTHMLKRWTRDIQRRIGEMTDA